MDARTFLVPFGEHTLLERVSLSRLSPGFLNFPGISCVRQTVFLQTCTPVNFVEFVQNCKLTLGGMHFIYQILFLISELTGAAV